MSHFAPGLSVLPVKNRPKGRLARWGIYASIINEVRRMRRALFSCFCGLLWISSGWAADPLGTININLHGNVVDFSCTVNTADIDKTVDLGRWPTTQLLNAGDTTALVPFSLRLEGCPPGSVAILFTERRHPIPTCWLWMIPQWRKPSPSNYVIAIAPGSHWERRARLRK